MDVRSRREAGLQGGQGKGVVCIGGDVGALIRLLKKKRSAVGTNGTRCGP